MRQAEVEEERRRSLQGETERRIAFYSGTGNNRDRDRGDCGKGIGCLEGAFGSLFRASVQSRLFVLRSKETVGIYVCVKRQRAP